MIKNRRLISTFMTSQPGLRTIAVAIYILSNISQSKDNQIIKFDPVVELDKESIFLKKSCRK